MIPCSALEQGIGVIEQGISSEETAGSPIPGALGNRIPLALFLPNEVIGADRFRTRHPSQDGRFL
jgi:hypothetical protein